MAGTAVMLIDKLLTEKAKGDTVIGNGIRVKLRLKGIPVDKLTAATTDDPVVINKIKAVLLEFGLK